MAKSVFITATGTDIGKTYVSALIVKKMREYGYNCGYFKPVLSGAYKENGELIPGDCKHVVETSGLDIEPIKCLSYCFEEAVSPHLASERLGVNIDIHRILSDYKKLSKEYDYMVIEGAGGITCPIKTNNDNTYMMSDLIKDMGVNVIVIGDGGLGTINSILTTVEYIKNRGINIIGIILNNYDNTDFMHKDNYYMVEKLTGLKILGTIEKNSSDFIIDKSDIEQFFK